MCQLVPPSVLLYTPPMSQDMNIRFGLWGDTAGTNIAPPPPGPAGCHSMQNKLMNRIKLIAKDFFMLSPPIKGIFAIFILIFIDLENKLFTSFY